MRIRRSALMVALLAAVLAGCSSTPSAVVEVTVTGSTEVSAPATAAASATSSTSEDSSESSSPVSSTSSAPAAPPAVVTATPALDSTDLSPSAPITISVADGTIQDLKLTNPEGKVVAGSISEDGHTWSIGEVLGFGKTYTVAGTAVNEDGKTVPIAGTYSMLDSDVQSRATITPGDGSTVGVAQPVMIRFAVEPEDKAAVQKALTITTVPEVEGSWAWVQHDDGWGVDWRPKDYWPAGTTVHVEAKLYGVRYAAGAYGSTDLTTDFTVGRSQVVYADATTHEMVVKQGCTSVGDPASCTSTVATYPASFGSGDIIGDPNRVTRSGVHVVNEMLPVHEMNNPEYGYVNSVQYWDVRISNNGEFIHQNQNTVDAQGSTNVSHGCINLSAEHAEEYFNSALIGDPVEVTGTSVQLSPADGDIFDWAVPWDEWTALSAL